MKDKQILVEKIATQATDNADLKELMRLYYDETYSYMSDLSMSELKEIADDMGIE